MKNMTEMAVGVVALMTATVLFAEGSATALSGLFAVDSRSGDRRSVASAPVGYAPDWSADEDVVGANVVIERVDHAGMFNATTTTVAVCAADVSGTQIIVPAAGTTDSFRLIHRTCRDGQTIGEPLVSDVAIGVASDPGKAFVADSRTNSLQIVAKEKGTARIVYDTGWTNDVARLSIARTDGKVTNEFFSVAADAAGEYAYSQWEGAGWNRFLLTFFGAGNEVIDTLVTEPFRISGGFVIILK